MGHGIPQQRKNLPSVLRCVTVLDEESEDGVDTMRQLHRRMLANHGSGEGYTLRNYKDLFLDKYRDQIIVTNEPCRMHD